MDLASTCASAELLGCPPSLLSKQAGPTDCHSVSRKPPVPRSKESGAFEAPRAGLAQLGIKYTALAMSDTASDVQQGVHHTGPR